MRVCFLVKDLTPGTEAKYGGHRRFANELMDGIKERGGVKISVIENIAVNFNFLRRYSQLRSIVKKSDIIHALDGWPCGVVGYLLTLGLKKRLIVTAEGTGSVKPLANPLKSFLLKKAFRAADVLTAISRFTAEKINEHIPRVSITIINHGINLDHFRNSGIGNNISKYQPFILSVGDIRRRKGYHISLRAFAEVAKERPDLKYVIVGYKKNDSYGREVDSLIKSLEIEDKVFLLKDAPDSQLNVLYQTAELFILLPLNIANDFEGFGLVFLEAAASGLPSIATRGNGSEDAVIEGQTALVVSQNSPSEAVEAIVKLMRDPKLRKKMAQNAKNFAATKSWESVASKYIQLYQSLV